MRIPSSTPSDSIGYVVPVPPDPDRRRSGTTSAQDEAVTLSPSLRAHIEQANRSAAESTVEAMGAAEGRMMSADQAAAAVQSVATHPASAANAAHAGLSAGRVLGLLAD